MRKHLPAIMLLCVAALSPLATGQTRPVDDATAVVQVGREFINAARALDRHALLKLYAPAATPEATRAVQDMVWFTLEVQKLRLAAERKLGPEPAPGEETEEWAWGIIPLAHFDAAMKAEPTIVSVNDDRATLWLSGGLELAKQPNGRWLLVVDESASGISQPDDPAEKAELDKKFKAILNDIESGAIQSAGDVPQRIMEIFMS